MHLATYSYTSRSHHGSDRLARNLGWLGLGVGLCQLFAPRQLTRCLGLEGTEQMVRLCGTRNVAAGVGALTHNPKPALWVKAGGDAMDFAALAAALRDRHNPKRENLQLALLAVGASTALSLYVAQTQSKRHAYQGGPAPDYSSRSGFPGGLAQARGAAIRHLRGPDYQAALPSPARSPGARTQSSASSPIRPGEPGR